ncbi:hypothetical protein ES703_43196 [subsurface metagenome]
MKLEAIGKIIAAGWGDKVLVGIFTGFLKGVTPERCYQYIKEDMQLGYWVSDMQWERFRRMAKGAKVGDITTEDITNDLRKHRPDILGIILNHPDGEKWLDRQITEMKKKLGLE